MKMPIEWTVSPGLVPYPAAVAAMEERAAGIAAGRLADQIWLLEHPPIYTAGSSAREADLIEPGRLPVYRTGRGGQFTYHGPGQRVAYVMLDLKTRGRDIKRFVFDLEQVAIETLAAFGVEGERRPGRVGVWVLREDGREEKIAAIGVRVRHWVSYHGLALNVAPDLADYAGIIACGLADYGVTSLKALGAETPMAKVDETLRRAMAERFGAVAESQTVGRASNG